jgi:hypothetical protein
MVRLYQIACLPRAFKTLHGNDRETPILGLRKHDAAGM